MDIKVLVQLDQNKTLECKPTEGKDTKEKFLELEFITGFARQCGKCGSKNIKPISARRTKDGEFIYLESYCFDCRAFRPSGEYKSPKGVLFWKQWQDPYVTGNELGGCCSPEPSEQTGGI